MAKDTNGYIKDLNNFPPSQIQSEQRQRKIQRERLQDEFTSTLNLFQTAQKSAAQKEKEEILKAKEKAFGEPFLASYNKTNQQLIELQDSNSTSRQQQAQVQEEADLRALQEQEESVRELEVLILFFNSLKC